MQEREPQPPQRSEFLDALRKGVLIGAALLVVLVPAVRMHKARQAAQQPLVAVVPSGGSAAPAQPAPPAVTQAPPGAGGTPAAPAVRLADFGREDPTPDARLLANWVVYTGNNKQHAFVVVDKKDARVYVFSPQGKLKDSAPVLLGAARGDDSYPGIGDKPLSAVKPWEKTTPAGRFVAEPGENANNEDVVWVDYDAAVSMHRIRPLVARERRLERLATLTTDDNRISFGCINLPVSFYEDVLSPAVRKSGAIIYVMPEVKSLKEVFGAYDVQAALQQASVGADGVHQVALQQGR